MATSTTLDDLMVNIKREVQFITNHRSDLTKTISLFDVQKGVNSISLPSMRHSVATALVEGNAFSGHSAVSTSGITLTPAHNAVAADYLYDIAKYGTPENAVQLIGRKLGADIATKINRDIFALFDGFSNTVGDSTSAISAESVLEARALLTAAGAPGPYYLAVTPWVFNDILRIYANSSAAIYNTSDALRNEIQTSGRLMEWMGFRVIEVADLADNAGGKDSTSVKCAAYSPEAIAMAHRSPLVELEFDRVINRKATEIIAAATYQVSEWQDDFGVEIICANND